METFVYLIAMETFTLSFLIPIPIQQVEEALHMYVQAYYRGCYTELLLEQLFYWLHPLKKK